MSFASSQEGKVFLRDKRELGLDNTASFVEYLRWMRSPQGITEEDNNAKAQLLQLAAEKSRQYRDYFERRNEATRSIAKEEHTFEVECTWRVRVGGMRGPEDMLLPAFDAAGMPYIPASSLRGVAREIGVRNIASEKIDRLKTSSGKIAKSDREQARKEAEAEIAAYLGSLEAKEEHQAGKVIFLDAYPLGKTWGQHESGLAIDIANSIWKWEGSELSYSPNPNLFLSLKKPTFLVGLRRTRRCHDRTFEQVKAWLLEGLQAGIGSQVNSGYGEMKVKKVKETISPILPFLQVNFTLTGQLIHSYQHIEWNRDRGTYDKKTEAEVRPAALKSMLRYWFRALALGVLEVAEVRDRLEPQLFGAIEPQTRGWLKCRVVEQSSPRPRRQEQDDKKCLSQQGILKLSLSEGIPEDKEDAMRQLFLNLTWLAFHLGGVGQGARRPKHRRNNKPFYRGSQLRAMQVKPDICWESLPNGLSEFKGLFQKKMRAFYRALERLSGRSLSPEIPRSASGRFREAIGNDCQIVVCRDAQTEVEAENKPFALDILHNLARDNNGNYDRQLCGDANSNPSPVWIADLGSYQVVTVFGAGAPRRREFLRSLKNNTSEGNYYQLWPLGNERN